MTQKKYKQELALYVTLASLIVVFLVACNGKVAEQPSASQPAIELQPCQLSMPGVALRLDARCGKLAVFEDRQAQSGRQIELNIAVIPAVSRNPAPDPIFFLAGGPGEAATESYLVVYSAFQLANQKRDIVLVDQRGTGGSNPLDCPNLSAEATPAAESGAYDETALYKACLEALDADPRLYTTAIAADDLDQVREALGYPQVNLYGASYGTRVALAYARQHPERLRAMILDGVVPMDWTLGPAIAGDAQRALDLIFSRCKTDAECSQRFPNLEGEFQALLAGLADAPRQVALDHPVTGEPIEFTLTGDLFASLVHTSSYAPETAALLPLMIHTAHEQDDFTQFAAMALSNFETLYASLSQGMRFSVVCSEDAPFMKDTPASRGYLGDFYTRSFLQICEVWPPGDIPADFKKPVYSEVPTLLLSGEADPVTPPSNAAQAAQTLPNSLQITVPGQGHVVIFRGCLPRLATRFIETASLDGLDTSCVKEIEPMPFFLNVNGPKP